MARNATLPRRRTARSSRSGPRHHHDHSHGPDWRSWRRADALALLESPARQRSQDPDAVWQRVRLSSGATVVDLGAGTGFFAIPAARRVGPSGRVIAVDLAPDLVALVAERAGAMGLSQLTSLESTPEHVPLPTGEADVVLLANVLHDLPPSTVREAVRLLKPGGTLVNVDWKRVAMDFGPPLEIRLSPAQVARRFGPLGLHKESEWEVGPWHYGMMLRKVRPRRPTARARSSLIRRSARRTPHAAPQRRRP